MRDLLKGAFLVAVTALVTMVVSGRAEDKVEPLLITCVRGSIDRITIEENLVHNSYDLSFYGAEAEVNSAQFGRGAQFHNCTIVPEPGDGPTSD